LKEKIQEQDRALVCNQFELGKLYCRVYYHLKEETLYVESKSNYNSALSYLKLI